MFAFVIRRLMQAILVLVVVAFTSWATVVVRRYPPVFAHVSDSAARIDTVRWAVSIACVQI